MLKGLQLMMLKLAVDAVFFDCCHFPLGFAFLGVSGYSSSQNVSYDIQQKRVNSCFMTRHTKITTDKIMVSTFGICFARKKTLGGKIMETCVSSNLGT